jgi:hypothetical protein
LCQDDPPGVDLPPLTIRSLPLLPIVTDLVVSEDGRTLVFCGADYVIGWVDTASLTLRKVVDAKPHLPPADEHGGCRLSRLGASAFAIYQRSDFGADLLRIGIADQSVEVVPVPSGMKGNFQYLVGDGFAATSDPHVAVLTSFMERGVQGTTSLWLVTLDPLSGRLAEQTLDLGTRFGTQTVLGAVGNAVLAMAEWDDPKDTFAVMAPLDGSGPLWKNPSFRDVLDSVVVDPEGKRFLVVPDRPEWEVRNVEDGFRSGRFPYAFEGRVLKLAFLGKDSVAVLQAGNADRDYVTDSYVTVLHAARGVPLAASFFLDQALFDAVATADGTRLFVGGANLIMELQAPEGL